MIPFERETVAVSTALRERDTNTSDHCNRTCALSLETARAIGIHSADLVTLHLAAGLHDVGKIGIPDYILFKADRLDEEELHVMQTHPRRGYDILTSIPDHQINVVAEIVLHHHEAVDGTGYPEGLKGEEIPVLARILCVADSYDAIATIRPYHKPRNHTQVMQILYEQQGHKYDPYVLAAFTKIIEFSAYKALN